MPQSYTQLLYHIVFATKNREPWLKDIGSRVHTFLAGGIREEGGVALCVGGVEDHVHLLARLRQDKAISSVVGAIKAISSGWIHRKFESLHDFAWQNGYSAFTVSKSQRDIVRRYIDNQAEHHRNCGFKEELIALLDLVSVEFVESNLEM